MGHLSSFSREWECEQKFSKNSNAQGVAQKGEGGRILKLRFELAGTQVYRNTILNQSAHVFSLGNLSRVS